jgi:hypothetical protein
MKPDNEKYNKVLNLLRESKPELDNTDEIERMVLERIRKKNVHGIQLSNIFDFFFRWVYIDWVRRSLITASVALVVVFAYQQAVILKRIDTLSRQTIIIDKGNPISSSEEVEKKLTSFMNSGRKFPLKTITISEKQMKELAESVEDLQVKYKDLEKLIESDPELKKMIEKKLFENNRTKINL